MHELAMAKNVLEVVVGVAELNAAKRVKSIRLAIGEPSHVDRTSLSFCFEVASRGTLAEGARLEFRHKQSKAACPRCQATWSPAEMPLQCPLCGEATGTLIEDEDVLVESVDIED